MHPSLVERLEKAEKNIDDACRRFVVHKQSQYECGEIDAVSMNYHEACDMRDLLGDAIRQITRKN